MSLPQRGGTSLEMWSYDNPEDPIESFDGHADVVKEFVWRSRGGYTIEGGRRSIYIRCLIIEILILLQLKPIISSLLGQKIKRCAFGPSVAIPCS